MSLGVEVGKKEVLTLSFPFVLSHPPFPSAPSFLSSLLPSPPLRSSLKSSCTILAHTVSLRALNVPKMGLSTILQYMIQCLALTNSSRVTTKCR